MNLEEIIRELRERNEPVPKPLHLPTAQEVEEAQRKLRVTFHPDYRRYLLEASDVVYGALEPATVTPGSGHTELIGIAQDAWELGVPRSLIPLCEDNGDYYCMNKAGQVVFWSHDGLADERWADLATWIKEVWIDQG
jgi:hypothetical protein